MSDLSRVTAPHNSDAGSCAEPATQAASEAAFGRRFWLTYGANSLMMVAISLLFRYGDYINCLGGTELELGWIVCAGMVGSLAMRLAQGVGIDTYGPRRIWLWSSAFFIASCAGHLVVRDIHDTLLYVLRIVYQTSVAGFFGASITYISGRAPVARMAEVVGTLGTSGFIGMVLGPLLGDELLRGATIARGQVDRMFLAAAGLGLVSFVLSWLATHGHPLPPRRKRAPLFWLLRRYHPGAVLLTGVAMGFGLGLPGVFLSRYAAELGIHKLRLFFGLYACIAFFTRLAIRRMPERHGVRPMILIGLASLSLGMLLFPLVKVDWQFVFPALFIGAAHALLFPAVIAGGSGAFPARYRGLGTTVMLATFDLGNLIGAPVIGEILHWSQHFGWPAYPTMFVSVSLLLALAALVYAACSRGPRQAAADVLASKLPATPEIEVETAAAELGRET
ncbi:MAG TPA: MFS transporter [Pirellulales bacterium]|nr:MFS transporter [Pirellulales bacterium]